MFIKGLKLVIYADFVVVEKWLTSKAKDFPIFVRIMVPVRKFLYRIIGNQVQNLDSTRCCNLLIFPGTKPATVLPVTIALIAPEDGKAAWKWRESEDLP